ncbi:MAG: hypothetical protein IJP98_04410 [Clostridia bacterium]|nr:hypothetical protein [Clostridia bacterium]
MFSFFRGKPPYEQSAPEDWRDRWRSLVPPECRNVPVAADGESVVAFILMNHFAVMLQDGLLMEASFFPVCEHFQKAGYHVVWLMRCTQDVYNGYLKRGKTKDGTTTWIWKSPTTNFGRWISDNREATILLQHTELPDGDIRDCDAPVLTRVNWATSDDPTQMVPKHTEFLTVDLPATPKDLLKWLSGETLARIASEKE